MFIRVIKFFFIGIIFIFYGCTITYKFEADQERYIEFFPKERPKNYEWSSEIEFHNNYWQNTNSLSSIYFPKGSRSTWINIEHLVKLVDYDVNLLTEVKHNNYLFSAIEVHKDLNIEEITLEHFYKGRKLKEFKTYIYKYSKNNDEK